MNGSFQITLKILLWDKNFFLYLKDKVSNTGDLPGGRIYQNELYQFEEALKREIQEELGDIQYEIHPDPVFAFPHFIQKDKKDAIALLFSGKYLGGQISLSEEHSEYKWIHKNEKLEKYFSGTFLEGLNKYFKKYEI